MLDQLASITSGGGRLLRAEGEMLLLQARRACAWGALAILGVLGVCLGLLGVLTALTAAFAQEVGWIWATAAASGVIACAGGVVILTAKVRMRRSTDIAAMPDTVRSRAADARREMAGEPTLEEAEAERQRPEGEDESWQDKAVRFAMENPGLAAGGAFAVVAILGPWRTMRMVSRGMMLAGLASNLLGKVGENDGTSPDPMSGTPRKSQPTPDQQAAA